MNTQEYNEFRDLLRSGDCRDASALAERMVLLSGELNGFWWTQLAVGRTAEHKYPEAVTAAERALQLQPDNGFALHARADALKKEQKFAEAYSAYEEGLADGRVAARCRQGMLECLSRQEKWEALLTLLSSWSLAGAEARQWRAAAFAGLDRVPEAIAECQAWLQDEPDCPKALWQLAELEIRNEGLDAVLQRLGRLARIPSRPAIYGEIYASLCRRAGRKEDASKQYAKLAERSGNDRHRRMQAFTMAKAGQEQEAVPIMEEMLRTEPEDMYMHKAYAAACRRLKDLDRAWNFYTELLTLHPDKVKLHGYRRNIGKMMEKMA